MGAFFAEITSNLRLAELDLIFYYNLNRHFRNAQSKIAFLEFWTTMGLDIRWLIWIRSLKSIGFALVGLEPNLSFSSIFVDENVDQDWCVIRLG